MSELVADAARYTGCRTVYITVERQRNVVRIAVRDASRSLPVLISTGPLDKAGRALHLVDYLAECRGARLLPGGKQVWFELRFPTIATVPSLLHAELWPQHRGAPRGPPTARKGAGA